MPLVFFNGLGVTCYVGGVGGREYLCQAKQVAERMGIAFPPIAIWRPRDRYVGLAQLEALLTLRSITRKSDVQQGDLLVAPLRAKLATIQGKIEELELNKKKIANCELDHSLKVEKIRALSEQQNALRRGTNFALAARQLALIENAKRALDLHPCMVDYAINFGMKNAFEQWEAFLNNVGDLRSDINMRTKLDQQLPNLFARS
jgi:DNA-binding transcriptional MerR regulator